MILSSIVRRCGLETAWRKNRVRTNDPDSYRNYYIDTIIFRCRRKRICLGNFSQHPSDVVPCSFHEKTLSSWASLNEQASKSLRNRIFLSVHICHPSESVIGFPVRIVQWPRKKWEKQHRETSVSLEAIWTLIYALALDPRPKAPA